MELFFASVTCIYEPQYSSCREVITKVCIFIAAIDNIYELDGYLDELEVFTNAVKRLAILDSLLKV